METNLFMVIIDGLRWQEVFRGADLQLLNDPLFVSDRTIVQKFSAQTKHQRRNKLFPFLWNVVATRGVLYGDRDLNNKVNTANFYATSYAGYNEIFTGKTSLFLFHNKKLFNPNINVLESIAGEPAFKDNIAIFSSWNVLPYILNKKRNGLFINSASDTADDKVILGPDRSSTKDKEPGIPSPDTRYDHITYDEAKKYIKLHHPRVLVIAFGEGDVQAHRKCYDLYLKNANQVDGWIGELWNLLQADPFYMDKTNLLICTDHGRGAKPTTWHNHRFYIRGSSQTWLGLLGPSIHSIDLAGDGQLYNKQIASMLVSLLGESH